MSYGKNTVDLSKFDKLTELKSEKVEFNIVSDIEKLNAKLKADIKKALKMQTEANKKRSEAFQVIRKQYEDAKKLENKLSAELKQYENASLEAEILFKEAKQAAGNLGVNYKDVKGVSDLEKTVNNFDSIIEDIKADVTGITYNIPNI